MQETVSIAADTVGLTLGVLAFVAALLFFAFRLESRQQKIIELLERISTESHKEHTELLDAVKDARLATAEEHKEMILLMQGIKEPLIEAVAVLKSHVADERVKR